MGCSSRVPGLIVDVVVVAVAGVGELSRERERESG